MITLKEETFRRLLDSRLPKAHKSPNYWATYPERGSTVHTFRGPKS